MASSLCPYIDFLQWPRWQLQRWKKTSSTSGSPHLLRNDHISTSRLRKQMIPVRILTCPFFFKGNCQVRWSFSHYFHDYITHWLIDSTAEIISLFGLVESCSNGRLYLFLGFEEVRSKTSSRSRTACSISFFVLVKEFLPWQITRNNLGVILQQSERFLTGLMIEIQASLFVLIHWGLH